MEKVLGQTCPQCGKAKIVKNPKTDKLFCEDKCWLNQGNPTQAPKQPLERNSEPNNAPPAVDWDKIRDDKNDNIKQMNAINGACALWSGKDWDKASVEETIDWLYKYQTPRLKNGEMVGENPPY